jgi:hypothetical protein
LVAAAFSAVASWQQSWFALRASSPATSSSISVLDAAQRAGLWRAVRQSV